MHRGSHHELLSHEQQRAEQDCDMQNQILPVWLYVTEVQPEPEVFPCSMLRSYLLGQLQQDRQMRAPGSTGRCWNVAAATQTPLAGQDLTPVLSECEIKGVGFQV